MTKASGTRAAQQVSLQGIVVPAGSIDPTEFMKRTRRLNSQQAQRNFQGLGTTETVQLLQTGIATEIQVRFVGQLVVTVATTTTQQWPYGLMKSLRLNANGQTNLINVGGWDLKLREIMAKDALTDRGVSATSTIAGGSTITQGSLKLNSESWGVGQGTAGIGAGTYPVDLEWTVPVAMDQHSFTGAIFAQTTATDIVLLLESALASDLFTAGTYTLTGTWQVVPKLFSIPAAPGGDGIVVPDLSTFHSLIRTRTNVQNGDNEIRLIGQGAGKQLMRLFARTWNGATPAPLPVNDTNYGQIAWRYGQNDTPETVPSGIHMRYLNERDYGADVGVQGYLCWDFASENAFRDSVDMGAAQELRLLANIPSGVVLTNAFMEYTQETLFMGATAL